MTTTAIVFLTHVWHEAVGRRFERLRRETASTAECHVLLDSRAPGVEEGWRHFLAGVGASAALVPFTPAQVSADLGLRFFGLRDVLSNSHLPMLWFARTRKQYDYVWQVEYDAEYRGRWGDFFAPYGGTDAALLAVHYHRWSDWPDWFWWPSFTFPPDVAVQQDELCKAFMPVMRMSRAAMECVERAHRQGWFGHAEAVVPTALLREGHRLEDLNVRKTCYMGWYQDPVPLLPLLSTIRCRPFVGQNEFLQRGQGPMLFHPVKEPWTWDGEKIVNWR